FGPEGCGKTAWLKQATETLREMGYEAIYVDPMRRDFVVRTDVRELVEKFAEATSEAIGVAQLKLATLAIDAVKWLVSKWRRGKVAVLVDDAFQAIGPDKAAMYVKALLGLVEYPPEGYERIVAIAATSEGLSRREIGRHRWATIRPMWNMSKKGFEELYEKLPGPKPDFEEAWRLTGGNPEMLAKLYEAKWKADAVVAELVRAKELTKDFIKKWSSYLKRVVEDPQSLWEEDFPDGLREELIAKNLIVYNIYDRDPWFWIDEPPPEKDLELGIGKDVAWQTPLHREAVRRAVVAFR
ncbi:MAG: ATPase, partial [Candidatus Verstraetearchaeota archaeon]|nr:ATPase [Candidatus Verstraetearchaeota archaeon]